MSDATPNPVASPYRGIHPFRYVDQAYFFGREGVTRELFAEILLRRLVVLFGDSGAGKSSLVNAGLIPALEREGFRPERIRVRPNPEQPLMVERIAASERDRDYLPSIFAEEGLEQTAGDGASVSCSLPKFLAATVKKHQEERPVLIFDQFEELFTLFEFARDQSHELISLQRSILDSIIELVNNKGLRVKVLLNVREDFLGKLEVLAKDYPRVLDYRVRLQYFTVAEATIAILRPFWKEQSTEEERSFVPITEGKESRSV
jgi:hypothetical protein